LVKKRLTSLSDKQSIIKIVETSDHFKNGATPKSQTSREIKFIKMKNTTFYLLISLTILFYSCSNSDTTQVAENTFVYKTKVYKIVDNEITVIGDLKSDSIRKYQIQKPVKKDFGKDALDYIKPGAYATLDALYRGTNLYFNLHILGFNDLKEKYSTGHFIIRFEDEFGFVIHSTEVPTNELTGMLDENNEIVAYRYNGKTEMSIDIYKAIKNYNVSSTVKEKSKSSYWGL